MTVHKDDDGAAALTAEILRVPVRFGRTDLIVEIGTGQRIDRVLEIVALEHGLAIENLIIVRDGDDEALDRSATVDHHYPHERRHHVHLVRTVEVTVHYQAGSNEREFRRHAPLEHVLDWAIQVFSIDLAMAGEFELARAGSTEELPLSEHVGHLAGKHDKLELDLVRGDIANGARHD